jgi:PAS domain S-box-containing protein
MSDRKAPTTGPQSASTAELSDHVREIEDSFRLLIENVKNHGIFLMDAEGRIASWNIGVERLFGYNADEVIAQPFSRLFPSDQSQTADAELDRAKAEGRASNDRWLVRKNGTKLWCNGATIARRDSEGKLIGFAEVVRDLTHERETGEALKDALAYANNIIATLREPFLVLDRNLRVIRANHAFYTTFHVSNEETENRFIYELGNHQWDIPRLRMLLEQLLSNSHPIHDFEVEHTFPALGHRIMLLNACRLESLNGHADLILLAIEDIDDRRRAAKKIEVSEVRYRRLFEAAQDAILILDNDTAKVIDANPFICDLLGYTRDELMGKELWEIGLFTDIEANRAATDQLKEKGYIRYEHIPLETKTGQSRAVEFVSNVYAVDGTKVIQCNIRDVTDRKRAEDALKEGDRRKNEFLAMLSHELRNPLAPIRYALNIVQMRGQEGEAAGQAWATIERQVETLVRLVDDLLDMSRISRGKISLHKQRVDVATIVARAIESSRPLIEARRHELQVTLPDEPMLVDADVTRMAQVLLNLLNNAAKYTPEGGRIWVTAEKGPGDVAIRVRDNGMGIPAEVLPAMFDLFRQDERTLDRAEGGLGIGLTLVRSLTELHEGTVEASSVGPGQGSEFVVRLPLLKGALPPAAPAKDDDTEPFKSSSRRRILVLDDNRDSAESLAMLLRLVGHDVRTVHDGRQALVVAEIYSPDLVLLDIGLPGMDGYEVARRLRAQPWIGQTKLVALTGFGGEEDRRQAQSAGLDHHLVKPVDFDALRELLAALDPSMD